MDEFQYQIYFNKITSLTGTKKPLADLIKEIIAFNSNDDAVLTISYKFRLINYAINVSSAKNPKTYKTNSWLVSAANTLCDTSELTPQQIAKAFELYPTNITFYTDSIFDLIRVNDIVKLIHSTNRVSINPWGMSELRGVANPSALAYMYLSAVEPDTPTLKYLGASDTIMEKAENSLKRHFEIIKTCLRSIK